MRRTEAWHSIAIAGAQVKNIVRSQAGPAGGVKARQNNKLCMTAPDSPHDSPSPEGLGKKCCCGPLHVKHPTGTKRMVFEERSSPPCCLTVLM